MRQLTVALSAFAAVAGAWLGCMETVLRHDGYARRIAIAAFIVGHACATLVFLHRAARRWTAPLAISAAAIACIGASAVWRCFSGAHFEGFALVIGAALLAQGILTDLSVVDAARRGSLSS